MKTQKFMVDIFKIKSGNILNSFCLETKDEETAIKIMEKLIVEIAAQLEFKTNGKVALPEIGWSVYPLNKHIDNLLRDGNVLLKQAKMFEYVKEK